MPQMLLFNMCEGPKKNLHHFGPFLSLFSAFLQLCKNPQSYISRTHQLMFPLVNNVYKWCQKLCNIFSSLHLLQGECVAFLLESCSQEGCCEDVPRLSRMKCDIQRWKAVSAPIQWQQTSRRTCFSWSAKNVVRVSSIPYTYCSLKSSICLDIFLIGKYLLKLLLHNTS